MERPEQVADEPTPETLMEWADAGGCRATDGCWLEQGEETCAHGHRS
jgi:hypothetical protein